MEPNLDQVAKELYGKIQTRFPDIKIADEKAQVLSKKEDIKKARFFEFEYKEGGEPLGTIAISLDTEDGIVIQISGDLTDDKEETTHHGAYKFIRSFRNFARQNMLGYEINNMGKSNLDKRDYEFHAKSGEEPMMESKMWGTSRVSYQDLGETRLVVKHSKPVNYELAAGRTMHIDAIYIENAVGERFRYPVKHLNGARAMAQHIAHGGNPYDEIGQHVVSLSEELGKLRMFKGYVSRTPVVSESMSAVNDKVIERIEQVKKDIHQLQQARHYETFAENFSPSKSRDIPEEIMLDWVDRLTVRSFKEELKDVFPYIYKLVDESEIPTKELDPDDLLDEAGAQQAAIAIAKKKSGKYDKDGKRLKESPEDEFENFLDSIVNEDEGADALNGNDDAVQKLKDLMAQGELKGDPNRIDSIKDLINDQELHGQIADSDPNLDARPIIQVFLQQRNPELAKEVFPQDLSSSDQEKPAGEEASAPEAQAPEAQAPEAPAEAPKAEEPAAAAPMAESDDHAPWYKDKAEQDADTHKQTFKKPSQPGKGMDRARALAQLALKKGAKSDTKIGNKTLHDVMMELGMDPEDPTAKQIAPPSEPKGDSFQDMMAFASGFFNKEERNFTRGVTDLETKLAKQFPGADPRDMQRVVMAARKIDPPSSVHNQEHDRMRRLAGVNPNGHDSPVPQHGSINESLSIIRKLSGLQ
jgi:hypothetical protein